LSPGTKPPQPKSARAKSGPPKAAKRRSKPPGDVEPRARLPEGERRAQLLALGRRLFTERPYDALSIDDIAAAAGISKGLLYHYFPSKRDFYVAIVDEAARQLLETTAPIEGLSPPEQAQRGIDAYLDFVEVHSTAYTTLLRGGIGNDPEVAARVERTRDALMARMMKNMGLESPRPVFRFLIRSWIGLVEAASIDWIDRREVSREVVARTMLDSLYQTIVAALQLDPEAPLLPQMRPS
jgi:AcrR family transcriptional regulator